MKKLLFLIILILAALLLVFNWGQLSDLFYNIRENFQTESPQCAIKKTYEEGKEWFEEATQ